MPLNLVEHNDNILHIVADAATIVGSPYISVLGDLNPSSRSWFAAIIVIVFKEELVTFSKFSLS